VHIERGLQTVESMTSGRHELCCDANLVTALFGAMCRPGAADSDQVRYVNYCKSAARHSLFLRKAILLGQHDEAVQSLAKLRQSCTDCHDRYR
jgi:hypothetical protein